MSPPDALNQRPEGDIERKRRMALPTVTGTGQTAHIFDAKITGFFDGGVTKVTATDNVTDVVHHNPGDAGQTYASPGIHRPGTCVLTKDWTNTPEWLNWYKTVQQGAAKKTDVIVTIHDQQGNEISSFTYRQCWPYKWIGPRLNSQQTGHAEESIEFTWETVELQVAPPKVG